MRMKKGIFTKTKTLIIAIAAIILIGIVNAQNNSRIMVFDFDAGAGITQNEVAFLTNILTVYLQEEFDVVSLEEIDRIISEQGFQRATMTEQQMEIVDSLLNVSKIITGSINTRRGEYRILATSIDVETGTIVTSVGETGDRFHRVAQSMAQSLLAEMERSEVPVPQEVAVETLLERVIPDRGVLINGVRWATSNVDVHVGTFVSSPEMAGRFNAWGVREDWSVLGTTAIDPATGRERGAPSLEDRPSIEDFRFGNINYWVHNDPCPRGWRIPYPDEFESLIAAGSFWTTVNGVGGRVFGTAPNQIFLPAAGGGGIDPTMDHIPTHVAHEGQMGYYWTRIRAIVERPNSPAIETAWRFWFSQVDVGVDLSGGFHNVRFGYSIRCVLQTDTIYVEF